jgi:transcription elongation GreA/GreB family factor
MTFTLNANTHKEGAVAVGSPVSVRYQESGTTHVATAVSVEQAKTKSSAKK